MRRPKNLTRAQLGRIADLWAAACPDGHSTERLSALTCEVASVEFGFDVDAGDVADALASAQRSDRSDADHDNEVRRQALEDSLEAVAKPGKHPVGAPGSLRRRAWDIGTELSVLRRAKVPPLPSDYQKILDAYGLLSREKIRLLEQRDAVLARAQAILTLAESHVDEPREDGVTSDFSSIAIEAMGVFETLGEVPKR